MPTAVAQFNNRFYFVIGNAIYFTDTLAIQMSNVISTGTGPQILTYGSNEAITAIAPLPLTFSSQLIQALIVFKQTGIALITGDDSQNNLAINEISEENGGVGTDAPRTVVSTPMGVMFKAQDGIRILQQSGFLSPPDNDIRVPFQNTFFPSRGSAGFNNNIYRICVQNLTLTGQPYQEFWSDQQWNGWTGPHSCRQDLLLPYENTFLLFRNDYPAEAFLSQVFQDEQSDFTENGSLLSWLMQTSPMQDNGGLYENSAVLSVVDMKLPQDGSIYNFNALDPFYGLIGQAQIQAPQNATIWGQFIWGQALWQAQVPAALNRYNIPWTAPLVFSRLIVQVSGPSGRDFKLGKLAIGYQPLQYVRI